MEDDNNLYDIVLDRAWLASAITDQMEVTGTLTPSEYVEIEHIEMDGDYFNIIVSKHQEVAN